MSSQPPSSSRRRRIAGERRGRVVGDEQSAEPTAESSSQAPAPPAPGTTSPVQPTGKAPDSAKPNKSPAAKTAPSKPTSPKPPAGGTQSKSAAETPSMQAENGSSESAVETSSTGWWGSRTSLLVLAGLLVVLLLLTGLAAMGLLGTDGVEDVNQADGTEQAMRTAPAAAEAAATAILAYDFKTLEADQDAATRLMTEDFGSEYSETFEKVVLPAAEENRAKVTATVLASSVMRATDDTARVLMFVNQATVSRANEQPQIALNRVEMSMVREGDRWLVADISSY